MKYIQISEDGMDSTNVIEVMDIRLITRQLEKIEGVTKVEGDMTLLIDSFGMNDGEENLRAEFWITSKRDKLKPLYTLEDGLIDAFPHISFEFHTIYGQID